MVQDNDFRVGLQQLFAANLTMSTDFQSWFLGRTKFRRLWPLARLLHDEQQEWRGPEPWWGNWLPDDGLTTDMLFVFEVAPTQLRFALHTAIAAGAADLDVSDIATRRIAAESMMNQECFLNYTDFETVLLAPQELIGEDARALNYDRRIAFEAVRDFIPNFGTGRRPAA